MLKIDREGILLRPTNNEFENYSAFNPGVLQEGDKVHVVYRASDTDHKSSLGYAELNGPFTIKTRWDKPFMSPRYKYEKRGLEDPRIVKIKDTVYLTYVAHDGQDALIAYAYGPNILKLKRAGLISAQFTYHIAGRLFNESKLKDDYFTFESYYKDKVRKNVTLWDKDGILFPEKIRNNYALIHRILPDVQVAYAKHMYMYKADEYWKRNIRRLNKYVMIEPAHGWETRHVGGGAPPIKTKHGWLFLYHGVEPKNTGRIYHTGAVLLDLKNPTKVIARLPDPLLSPEKSYEKKGNVGNVIFATGTSIFKDKLFIYYGAADKYVAVASVHLEALINEILKYPVK